MRAYELDQAARQLVAGFGDAQPQRAGIALAELDRLDAGVACLARCPCDVDVYARGDPPAATRASFLRRGHRLDHRDGEAIRVDASRPITKAAGRLLTGGSLDAPNTFEQPNRVPPTPLELSGAGGGLELELPPRSIPWVALEQCRPGRPACGSVGAAHIIDGANAAIGAVG